ncbi:MAG: hypothetical protein KBT47_03000, partial [Armatimonadetes bacterium]|nr:hypothetical protein [Candidatus Hippobium faecium]
SLGHYDSMQTDWVCGGVNEFSDIHGLNGWVEFLNKAWGYTDATEDNGERMGDYKKAVRLISPQGNIVAETQKSCFDTLFYKSPLPYISMDWREYNLLKPNPELIVVDTMNMPQTLADELSSMAKTKKTSLVLHSYTAGAESNGANYTNIWYPGNTINNPDLFASVIGQVSKGEDVTLGEVKFKMPKGVKITQKDSIQSTYKGEYYEIEKNGQVLLSFGDIPVLTMINYGKNHVFYYHINAGVDNALDRFAMDIIYEICNIKQEGETENGYLQRYKLQNGSEAIALYNRNSFETFVGPPNKWNYFKIKEEGAEAKVTVKPSVTGDYVVYDFLNNEIIYEGKGKSLTIEMKDLTANLYYIIPKAKSEEFIKVLQGRIEKLNYWEKYRFDRFPENW